MSNVIPNNYKLLAISGSIAPSTDTIKCALFTSGLTPSQTSQKYMSDISANEVSGTGYTTGGVTLTSKTLTEDDTNNRGVFSAANAVWASLTVSDIRYAVIYKSTGSYSSSPIMAILDLGGSQTQNGAQVTIQFSTSGIMYIG